MNIITDSIRKDKEYGELLCATVKGKTAPRSLPILISGLCEGASDAVYISLVEDIKKADKRAVLFICSEEKECVRVKSLLKQFGFRCAFYVGRDLTFYNITASHEYEHERLKVLSGLLD